MPPTLEQVDTAVDALDDVTGNIFRFRDVLAQLEELSRTNVDTNALTEILSRFRDKIPNLIDFNRVRADAQDLHEVLVFADVDTRIDKIKSRNDLLSDLNDELQIQVDKANSDASLLTRIKEGVEKATKTVDEVKALVAELTDTDQPAKVRIMALLERLGNISAILHPENA